MIAAAFLCLITHVRDGDGPLWCANGIEVRIAGVQAPNFENAELCRRGKADYVWLDIEAARSRRIVEKLTLNRVMAASQLGSLVSALSRAVRCRMVQPVVNVDQSWCCYRGEH